ncbi:hypothetical protein [Streptomyces xanthochromogenes]|uniref:hypothetical protein n=1 Tax=Streptomyces xanthochromogenes TaxID=67384 RepID=UPI0016765E9F|nr:hypothetical protein [Streptomyces xanthochromogenes]
MESLLGERAEVPPALGTRRPQHVGTVLLGIRSVGEASPPWPITWGAAGQPLGAGVHFEPRGYGA